MFLKRKKHDVHSYVRTGMAFFLLGILASQVADARIIGAFIANWIANAALLNFIQGFAQGFSLPLLLASIYFNLRGLALWRSTNNISAG